MKQSNEKKTAIGTAALYLRLSRDDGLDSESNSIQTQKALLTKVAKEKVTPICWYLQTTAFQALR